MALKQYIYCSKQWVNDNNLKEPQTVDIFVLSLHNDVVMSTKSK